MVWARLLGRRLRAGFQMSLLESHEMMRGKCFRLEVFDVERHEQLATAVHRWRSGLLPSGAPSISPALNLRYSARGGRGTSFPAAWGNRVHDACDRAARNNAQQGRMRIPGEQSPRGHYQDNSSPPHPLAVRINQLPFLGAVESVSCSEKPPPSLLVAAFSSEFP